MAQDAARTGNLRDLKRLLESADDLAAAYVRDVQRAGTSWAFSGEDYLASNQYLDELRASRPGAGFKQVSVPGDPESKLREERLEKGIPHPEEVWHAAEQLRSTIVK